MKYYAQGHTILEQTLTLDGKLISPRSWNSQSTRIHTRNCRIDLLGLLWLDAEGSQSSYLLTGHVGMEGILSTLRRLIGP